jgi:hypothetical protein
VTAAFDSTATEITAYEERQGGSVQLAKYPPTMRVAVCYLHGPWQLPEPFAQIFKNRGETPDLGIMYITEKGEVIQGPVGTQGKEISVQRP